jgi:catechol 2,3-dioxygenase-like lactoylglutathione lyase family enzyme
MKSTGLPLISRNGPRRHDLMMRVLITILVIAATVPAPLAADSVLRRTTLLVHDLEQSIAFYTALGLKPYYDARKSIGENGDIIGGKDLPLAAEPTDSRIVILVGPHSDSGMLGLLAYSGPKLPRARTDLEGIGEGDTILMFNVDDIHAVRDTLFAAGSKFYREPYPFEVRDDEGTLRAAGWRMFVYDPDGRLIEVAQQGGKQSEGR